MQNNNSWTYAYNDLGWLTQESTPNGNTTTYAYDTLGNLQKETAPDGGVTRYVYDANNRQTQLIGPNQYEASIDTNSAYGDTASGLRYQYNKAGKITCIIDAEGNVTKFQYDTFGNEAMKTLPNNSVYTYTYDGINRLKAENFATTEGQTPTTLREMAYSNNTEMALLLLQNQDG